MTLHLTQPISWNKYISIASCELAFSVKALKLGMQFGGPWR